MIAIDDKSILMLLQSRDESALSEISQQYGTLCLKIAGDILGSPEDAEECLNDALLTLWNAVPPAKPANLRAYLMKLVRNAAFNRYHAAHCDKRGGGQTGAALDELTETLPSSETVESVMQQRALSDAITAFLRRLPNKQRDLFVRRYWSMTPVEELSVLFGMSETNVKVTLMRLRKKLKDALTKEGLI